MAVQTSADILSLKFGTGYQVFASTILPAIEAAEHEVLFITCFWAPSRTRDALNDSLSKLSSIALQRQKNVRVRIGFSSSSLLQKLFHTSSPTGKTYQPADWTEKLGLLSKQDLPGLDVEMKSIFFLPFSVWHPKFVVVDRKRVFLPSCNVSWEDWYEGCVEISGPIVDSFVVFWQENWANAQERTRPTPLLQREVQSDQLEMSDTERQCPPHQQFIRLDGVGCQFLPSWHCRDPKFRLPWQPYAPPPRTPLNTKVLDLLASARQSVYMQTPNLTCAPLIDALLDALKRGVAVTIMTSERLMILEQLLTAGTTTARCVSHLAECYRCLSNQRADEEAGFTNPGRLCISYYVPNMAPKSDIGGDAEPVQSHLKLTVVDNQIIVLGSGNMDRASWYTSQELGVAFFSKDLSSWAQQSLQADLASRSKVVFDSANSLQLA